jgi:hypothetical protein
MPGWNIAARRALARRCYGAAWVQCQGIRPSCRARAPRCGWRPELAQDVSSVFDCVERHHQFVGDALIGSARGEPPQHLRLAVGQRLGHTRWCGERSPRWRRGPRRPARPADPSRPHPSGNNIPPSAGPPSNDTTCPAPPHHEPKYLRRTRRQGSPPPRASRRSSAIWRCVPAARPLAHGYPDGATECPLCDAAPAESPRSKTAHSGGYLRAAVAPRASAVGLSPLPRLLTQQDFPPALQLQRRGSLAAAAPGPGRCGAARG